MTKPVTETVHFHVTVNSYEEDGHWVSESLETTIYTYGSTRDEAERQAGKANVLFVNELKRQGLDALSTFMMRHGIEYSVGETNVRCSPSAKRLDCAA